MKEIDKERRIDDTKMLWHMDRVIKHFDRGERIPPVHIDAGLTKRCNMRCVYCYGYFQNMTGEVMGRKAVLDNLVKSSAEIGVRSLAFIGDGEPSLNPAYWEAMRLGNKLGLSLNTSTNGILVDNDYKRESILKCDWMRVNISAFSKKGFEKIHTSKLRDKVLKNIIDLVKYRDKNKIDCEIGIQTVFVPTLMMKELVSLSQFAIDNGVDFFSIKQCSLPDKGESGMSQFDLNLYSENKIQNLLEKVENMSTEKTKIIPKWRTMERKGVRKYDGCPAIPLILETSGNGDCYPCGYLFGNKKEFLKYKFGNLHQNSLKEMVYSDKYWEIIRQMRYEFDVHKLCKGECRQMRTNEFIWDYLHPPKVIRKMKARGVFNKNE